MTIKKNDAYYKRDLEPIVVRIKSLVKISRP